MSILITGCSGFVGGHLTQYLKTKDIEYDCLVRDKSNKQFIIPDNNIRVVIHLAGRAHVLNETSQSPYMDFYQVNCEFALKVAKAAYEQGMKRFVYVSSVGVYGKSCSNEFLSESSELNPVEDYAKSKFEAERELKKLSESLGFELVIVRPALVYGYDAPGNIERLLALIYKYRTIPIAEKNNSRTFIYVENLVQFLLVAGSHPNAKGKIFNAADDGVSTRTLVSYLAKGMSKKPMLFSLPRVIWKLLLGPLGKKKIYEQLFEDLKLDMSLAKRELDWSQVHSTKSALIETGKIYARNIKKEAN